MAKTSVDVETCIGCGACTSVCSNYEIKEVESGFKAFPLKEDVSAEELKGNKEAEEICPVDAIKVTE